MPFHLKILEPGTNVPKSVALDAETEHSIGRDYSCTIRLADPEISRRHAKLHFDGHVVLIEDLGSSNGLLISGRCARNATLREGERVFIGRTALELAEAAIAMVPEPLGDEIDFQVEEETRVTPPAFTNLQRALNDLAEAKRNDTATGNHLSVVSLEKWLEGTFPSGFLDNQLEGPWRVHYDSCEGCRSIIAHYRQEFTKLRGPND